MHSWRDGDPLRCLHVAAERTPERLFLVTPSGTRLTYAQFAALVSRMAGALVGCGVQAGDRVAAQVEKSPEAIGLYLACLHLNAVFVPLNTAYTLAELQYFLTDADPKLVIVSPASATAMQAMSPHRFETLDATGGGSLMDRALQARTLPAPLDAEANTLAALLYTSGTTGRSKGAMLTRCNLASNAQTLAALWRFTADDVLLHALPIFHVHGLFVAINTVLTAASSLLFLSRFDVNEVLPLLRQATVMMGVPTFYTRLLQHPGLSRDLASTVRLFISGSAPLLIDTHREFRERTGHVILERYGMSETLMNTSNPYDGLRLAGSVGPPLPGVEVRITEPHTTAPVTGHETVGMIEVRGPNVCLGYWRMPEKTAAEFRSDGFFITGDLGRIDAQGYVHIVGRGKDLVITGGFNVYPIEVEMEIDALPGVTESAVIGLPHADFGEAVTAVVIFQPGSHQNESSIRAALEQRLAKFKIPKRIVFIDELPRNTMGKVQKAALRERYRDLYDA